MAEDTRKKEQTERDRGTAERGSKTPHEGGQVDRTKGTGNLTKPAPGGGNQGGGNAGNA